MAGLGSTWPFYNVATPVAGETSKLDVLHGAFGPGDYRVWVRDGMSDAETRLLGGGFRSELALDAYVLDLAVEAPAEVNGPGPPPEGYDIGRATTPLDIAECVWGDQLSAWADLADAKAAFPDPYQMAQTADRRFYRARRRDRLVATAQSLLHQGVAGVYAVWTAEPHRSWGLASALLGLIRADAAAVGATHVTLQATASAAGLYTRAGFESRYTYRVYGPLDVDIDGAEVEN
jgi:GNAT superfamily N-acetyltransferase